MTAQAKIRAELISLPAGQGVSVLEQLERAGHQVPFQCREGYCGACRMELVEGKVHYRQDPLAWVNEGEILACSCEAQSEIQIKR
ncbi:MAG: 2Fe-2S ferredoxin-like protein [Saccharospirillum sp.]|nr:2Fe-2S ferredoxin-like protein [Saccharospirillum sp.]